MGVCETVNIHGFRTRSAISTFGKTYSFVDEAGISSLRRGEFGEVSCN